MDRIEDLEMELSNKEQVNSDLSIRNKKLVAKVVEF